MMFVGTMELDLLLGDVHSLKEKRSIVRPIVAELRRRFDVAVAETGHPDLHRRGRNGGAARPPPPRPRGGGVGPRGGPGGPPPPDGPFLAGPPPRGPRRLPPPAVPHPPTG